MRKKIREEKNVGSPDVETRTVGIELIIFHIFIGAFYTIPFGGFLLYNREIVVRLQYHILLLS